MPVGISEDNFGNSEEVRQFTLNNDEMSLKVINYGATIVSINIPDLYKKIDDIVLGYDDTESYINDTYYFGSTIGRFANRIAKGKFYLQDKVYSLGLNNGPNHLHGGFKGFNKVFWDSAVNSNKIIFSYTSPCMEEHYPGELKCTVTYELTNSNEIIIQYNASANESTPINLTNHSYFNLGGHDCETLDDHLFSINADQYTPVDENFIPTGDILPVEDTIFDLRKLQRISSTLDKILGGGFDHNFCINSNGERERKVARVEHQKSGRVMEIFSTQPGVQFYTANFLPEDNILIGKNGKCYKKNAAFCLETQNYPDAINHINFPRAFIDIGEEYKHTTRLSFSIK